MLMGAREPLGVAFDPESKPLDAIRVADIAQRLAYLHVSLHIGTYHVADIAQRLAYLHVSLHIGIYHVADIPRRLAYPRDKYMYIPYISHHTKHARKNALRILHREPKP